MTSELPLAATDDAFGAPVVRGGAGAGREDHLPAKLIGFLALASAITPFAVDSYLSGLPRVAADFGVSTSTVQLTLTAFLLGLAIGQLVIGPLSDTTGRRTPLLVGGAVCIAASVACAVAPNVELLIAARFLQGFSGAAGPVLARAIVTDRTRGTATARYFSLLMLTAAVAPVVAPISGALLIGLIGWRGILWGVAGVTIVMFVGATTSIAESLPRSLRQPGGLVGFLAKARTLTRSRNYLCYTAAFALSFMTVFAWASAAPFVLQDVFGLSSHGFAVAFAPCGVLMLVANLTNSRVVGRFGPRRMAATGISLILSCAVLMAVDVATGPFLWPTVLITAFSAGGMGLVLSNCAALAIGQVRGVAGTASAVLGASQFGLGAIVAPLVGIAGNRSAVPLAISMLCTGLLAAGAFRLARADA